MRTRSTKLFLVGSALALALAACDRPPDQRGTAPDANRAADAARDAANRTADAGKGVVDKTQAMANDATITAKVKSKFVADDQLKAHEINVDTKNGVVTLSGSVADPASKDRAAVVAREVEGVTSVNNQLVVRSS